VRRCYKLPPCPIEPMPASSKRDPMLTKAKSIGNCGSASVITYLRKGKNLLWNNNRERGVRRCERNNSADTKVSEKGGGGGPPGIRAEIPLQPMEKTMVRQTVLLQPVEFPVEQIYTCSPGRTPHQSRWMPKGGCDPMGSPCCSKLLPEPLDPWREEPMLEQVCWQDL